MSSQKVGKGTARVVLVVAAILIVAAIGVLLMWLGSDKGDGGYSQAVYLQIGSSLILGAVFVAVGWWFERSLKRSADERAAAEGRQLELDDYTTLCKFLNQRSDAPAGVEEEHDLVYDIQANGDVVISGSIATTVKAGHSLSYRIFKLSEHHDHGRAGTAFVDVDRPYEGVVLRVNPAERAGKWAVFFDPPVAGACATWKRQYRYSGYYKADLLDKGVATENFRRRFPTRVRVTFKFAENLRPGLRITPPGGSKPEPVGNTGEYTWDSGGPLDVDVDYTVRMER